MRTWDIGKKSLSLAEFEWDPEARRMLYGGWNITFGEKAQPPGSLDAHSSIRLYTLDELQRLFAARGMKIVETRTGYSDRPASADEMQIQIYSVKRTA
jgi:hypothetical protein